MSCLRWRGPEVGAALGAELGEELGTVLGDGVGPMSDQSLAQRLVQSWAVC